LPDRIADVPRPPRQASPGTVSTTRTLVPALARTITSPSVEGVLRRATPAHFAAAVVWAAIVGVASSVGASVAAEAGRDRGLRGASLGGGRRGGGSAAGDDNAHRAAVAMATTKR
jgi:hypothetical protein